MPSEIYNLAKSYADELSKLNKKKGITLDEFLNQKPEPTDQEIIEKITVLKDEPSVLTNFFKEKNNGFIKALGEIVPVENNLVPNKEFILFEQFISSCAKSIKNREKINQYNQGNSLLYQFSDEILVAILKFLSQEELAQVALVSSRFANIVNEIIIKAPAMPRNYNEKPEKISTSIKRVSHLLDVKMGAYYLYLLTPRLQLIMSFRKYIFIYDFISGENLNTLTIGSTITEESFVLCLAQLPNSLVISAGKINSLVKKNKGFIKLWNMQNYTCLDSISCNDPVEHIAVFSASEFCTASAKEIKFWINKNKIWECVKNIKINTTDPKDKIIRLMAIPGENQLIIATRYQIFICDAQEPKIIQTAALPNIDISCMQISPDKHLVIGATDGKVYLWHRNSEETWKQIKIFSASASAVSAITFLGDKIICGSEGPRNKNRGHVRAFDWEKITTKTKLESGVELHFGGQIIFLDVAHNLLISVDLDDVTVFYFPKLEPTLVPTTEEKKAETKNVIADAKQTQEENNKGEVADTKHQPIFMP